MLVFHIIHEITQIVIRGQEAIRDGKEGVRKDLDVSLDLGDHTLLVA